MPSPKTSDDVTEKIDQKIQDSELSKDCEACYRLLVQQGNVDEAAAYARAICPTLGIDFKLINVSYDTTKIVDLKHYRNMKQLKQQEDKIKERISQKLISILTSPELVPDEHSSFECQNTYIDYFITLKSNFEPFLSHDGKNEIKKHYNLAVNKQLLRKHQTMEELDKKVDDIQQTQTALYQDTNANQVAFNKTSDTIKKIEQNYEENTKKNSEEHQFIIELCEELGIEFGDSIELLVQLLNAQEGLKEDLSNVVNFLIEKDTEEKEQARRQNIETVKVEMEQAKRQNIARGLGSLRAIGETIGSPTLVKLASGGMCVMQLESACTVFKTVDSVNDLLSLTKLFSSMTSMAEALITIVSLFRKAGPSSHEIIMKQLQKIMYMIEDMHYSLLNEFSIVKDKLEHMEELIIQQFYLLRFTIQLPILLRLDKIQSDLSSLSDTTRLGFQGILLSKLQQKSDFVRQIVNVDPFEKNVVVHPEIWRTKIALQTWLKTFSYNPQLNGMWACGIDEFVALNPRQISDLLIRTKQDNRTFLNILITKSVSKRFLASDTTFLPHTGVWLESLKAYCALQKYLILKNKNTSASYLQMFFSSKSNTAFIEVVKEVEQIKSALDTQGDLLNALFCSEPFLKQWGEEVIKTLEELKSVFDNNEELMKLDYDKTPMAETGIIVNNDVTTIQAQTHIPEFFKFEYIRSTEDSHFRGRQRDFTESNGFSQKDCLKLLAHFSAETQKITLFGNFLILAAKAGFVEFRFKMHRTMRTGGNTHRHYNTTGNMYGLHTTVYFKDTQEEIELTLPTPGYASWNVPKTGSANSAEVTQKTIDSHKAALRSRTKLLEKNIYYAEATAKKLLIEKHTEFKKSYHRELANLLIQDNSLIYELLVNLQFIMMLLESHQYTIANLNCLELINEIFVLFKACDLNNPSIETINNFFKKLDVLLQTLKQEGIQTTLNTLLTSNNRSFSDYNLACTILVMFCNPDSDAKEIMNVGARQTYGYSSTSLVMMGGPQEQPPSDDDNNNNATPPTAPNSKL